MHSMSCNVMETKKKINWNDIQNVDSWLNTNYLKKELLSD